MKTTCPTPTTCTPPPLNRDRYIFLLGTDTIYNQAGAVTEAATRNLLLILTATLLINGLFAPATICPAHAGVSLGALAGITYMEWSGDRPTDSEYRAGYGLAAGLTIDIGISENSVLSLQPSYIQKGSKIAFELDGQDERVDSVDVRLDYVSLPIMLKVFKSDRRFYISGAWMSVTLLLQDTPHPQKISMCRRISGNTMLPSTSALAT